LLHQFHQNRKSCIPIGIHHGTHNLSLSVSAAEITIGIQRTDSGIGKGLAAVQVGGFAKVAYSGTTPSLGFAKLASDGNGGVAVNSNGQEYLVMALDEANKHITIKL
jgi:hypothetical protein